MRGRVWFSIHSWVGLKLHLLLVVILASGTLAVVAGELDWLLQPERRVEPRERHVSPGAMVAALERAYPRVGFLEGFISIPREGSRTAASALGVSEALGVRVFWVDPYTAEVRGHTPLLSVGGFFARLHTSLFVPFVGGTLVSLFALFLLTSTVTGILTYKRWWRGFTRRPRRRSRRLFFGDLHRLLGVWALAFLAVMTGTGLVYFYDHVGAHHLGLQARSAHDEVVLPASRLDALGPDVPTRLGVDELVTIARGRHPELVVTAIVLPQHAAAPFTVLGTRGEALVRPTKTRLDLDPYSGAIVSESLVDGAGFWRRASLAVDPLHFGQFGGMWSKVAWVLFGSMTTALALTGVLVHARRVVVPRGWLAGGAMGRWRPLNLAILAVGAFGLVLFRSFVARPAERIQVRYAAENVGPCRASLGAIDELAIMGRGNPIRPGATPLVLVQLSDGCTVKTARLAIGADEPAASDGAQVEGTRDYTHAHLQLPPTLTPALRLWLTIEEWNGSVHRTSWPLDGA